MSKAKNSHLLNAPLMELFLYLKGKMRNLEDAISTKQPVCVLQSRIELCMTMEIANKVCETSSNKPISSKKLNLINNLQNLIEVASITLQNASQYLSEQIVVLQ